MIAAKGFAIQKVLKDGKLIDEQGIMGEFNNKEGARIIEVNDGNAKYTQLTLEDIKKIISHTASSDSLEDRISNLITKKRHGHTHKRHTKRRHTLKGHTLKGHTHRRHTNKLASGHRTKRHYRKKHHKKTKKHYMRKHSTRRHKYKRRSSR